MVECWRWVDTIQVQLGTLEAVGLRQAERALLAIEGVSSLQHSWLADKGTCQSVANSFGFS